MITWNEFHDLIYSRNYFKVSIIIIITITHSLWQILQEIFIERKYDWPRLWFYSIVLGVNSHGGEKPGGLHLEACMALFDSSEDENGKGR